MLPAKRTEAPEAEATEQPNPEPRARELEAEAKRIEKQEPGRARELWATASRLWWRCLQEDPSSAWALARHLTCGRKAGFDPEALLQGAAEGLARHASNRWVAQSAAWCWRQLARERAEREDPAGALAAASRAIVGAEKNRDPALLLSCLAADLGRAAEAANVPGKQKAPGFAKELAGLLRERAPLFLKHLPAESEGRGKARRASALERFCYLVRKAAEAADDAELLESVMAAAVTRFADNEWFAAAHVRAARRRGDLDEARERGKRAFERLPGAWALAEERAEVELTAGRAERALKIMAEACLQATSPWPYRALARLHQMAGQPEQEADCLACGLGLSDRRDAGMVWRMHLDRAATLLRLERADEAAEEAWLAREARRQAGWQDGRELKEFLLSNDRAFDGGLERLDALAPGAVRDRSMAAYRKRHEAYLATQARPGVVQRWDPGRGFGFVRLEDGRSAFLHKSVVGGLTLGDGECVAVVVVRSVDRKKGQLGWKVVWFAEEQNQAVDDQHEEP